MLKTPILHPQILSVLGRSGHSSKVLIADGNYPFHTTRGPNCELVHLNFRPGMLSVPDVLAGLLDTIPIEAAAVMEPMKSGPYALKEDPAIWSEFRGLLKPKYPQMELTKIERFAFYEAAGAKDVCLTICTGEQRIYANLLLTIGVVM